MIYSLTYLLHISECCETKLNHFHFTWVFLMYLNLNTNSDLRNVESSNDGGGVFNAIKPGIESVI